MYTYSCITAIQQLEWVLTYDQYYIYNNFSVFYKKHYLENENISRNLSEVPFITQPEVFISTVIWKEQAEIIIGPTQPLPKQTRKKISNKEG